MVLACAACTGSVDGPGDLGALDSSASVGADTDTATDDTTDDAPAETDTDAVDTNPCTNGQAVFCDDFEATTLGATPGAPWKAIERGGTVTVDSAQAYSGTHAAKCETTTWDGTSSSYRQALLQIKEADAPITNNGFYGRMMVWYSKLLPSDSTSGNFHWSIVRSDGTVTTETYNDEPFTAVYTYGGQYGHLLGNYNSGNGPASDCWQHATDTVIPAQVWTCVEWQFDGPTDSMRFWVNGEAIDAATVVEKGQGCLKHDLQDRWVAPEFATISVGWENYQGLADGNLFYIDDVALGPQKLGCPTPPSE